MIIQKITATIIHVNFKIQKELTKTFCRFQEHYESPEFKGKVFTLGQYREWYSERYGAWTYYTDWSGFNLPDYTLQPFKDGLFDPLTDREQLFLDRFKHKVGKFYIIGTYDDKKAAALDHEICHALYYLDEEYQREVSSLIGHTDVRLSTFAPIRKLLIDKGYADEMLDDELQAYLACNSEHLRVKYSLDVPEVYKDFEELKETYFTKYNIGSELC